ncbi:MAG: zinc-dependent metalloprotease [Planctomycetota bacterium]
MRQTNRPRQAPLSIISVAAIGLTALAGLPMSAAAADPAPFSKVGEGLERVVSTTDGSKPLWDLYTDKKTGRLLAILPADYEQQLLMISCTVSGGDPQAGVMGPTHYAKWQRVRNQLMLVKPNLSVRTEGDKQAQDSVENLYTGNVMLDTPIVAMQGRRPVIDLGTITTAQASKFFGASVFAGYGPSLRAINPKLAMPTKIKAFPENVIVEQEAPASNGRIVRISYSIAALEGTRGFKPRKADPRVGYFYNWHQDFAAPANRGVTDRYINRWHMEKADPSLKLSPPKEPIVWYIEHTTPVRYRRFVREGIEMWNDAFRNIGIDGALEVRQQDASTNAFMDVDPEDDRYNFFRWNTTDQGYAIGPSRTNPYTGEILDADVVWHQGLTRSIRSGFESLANDIADQAFDAETKAFFEQHPDWDPRVRLAEVGLGTPPAPAIEQEGEDQPRQRMNIAHLSSPAACVMGNMLSLDFTLADAAIMTGMLETEEDATLLDGLPEDFVGQMIRYISAHEVGHCLGLQHNMTASTIRTLEEINSPGFEGPTVGSVMEYAAVNINHELGEVQGPYATTELGPYDHWAIAFGYGPASEVDEVLARVAEPDNIYVPQVAMSFSSDPRNVTWDLGADNLNFAESRLSLVKELRTKLLDEIVDEGESWAEARRRYQALLGTHLQSVVIASGWIGGSFLSNDFKGDPDGRMPIADVPADAQRRAMHLVIDNTFNDEAFGLSPELVRAMGKEYWWDPAGIGELMQDQSYSVNSLVGSIQATSLSLLMNPTRLRRVYDNEFRAGDDALTLDEIVTTVTDAAWTELDGPEMDLAISDFRRNLQKEHTNRLITLALMDTTTSPSMRTVSTLATAELRRVNDMVKSGIQHKPDTYTAAHLQDLNQKIDNALTAAYVIAR